MRLNIPSELEKVISLFNKGSLNYNLFKCEHIFAGANSNLDIIFATTEDYKKAGSILKNKGYLLYLPETVEKYKNMYVKVCNSKLFAVHLHREVAWHNIKIMDKEDLFQRQITPNKYIVIPSPEDSLLIHVAHILYENFKIRKREIALIDKILKKNLDWDYINNRAKQIGYHLEFYHILNLIKQGKQVSKNYCRKVLIKKIVSSPLCWLSFNGKIFKFIARKLSLKRKGCLISFIGVQGTGKTTMTRQLYDTYSTISPFFHGQFGYYFGWEPFSFYAKILAKIMKKKGKQIFKETNLTPKTYSEKKVKPSLFKELVFLYNYLEYLQRYWFVIYPKLRKNKLVITDRYFYDIYGMYSYAPKSVILKLLFKLYPRPDYTFLLDAKAEIIAKRGKNPEVFSSLKKNDYRGYANPQKINIERKRFYNLKNIIHLHMIDTEKDIHSNIANVINFSWRGLLR